MTVLAAFKSVGRALVLRLIYYSILLSVGLLAVHWLFLSSVPSLVDAALQVIVAAIGICAVLAIFRVYPSYRTLSKLAKGGLDMAAEVQRGDFVERIFSHHYLKMYQSQRTQKR